MQSGGFFSEHDETIHKLCQHLDIGHFFFLYRVS